MAEEFDLVILGGGTGGYVAAIRASQLGMKVAVVEKEKLGGTCLHKGCIPSKSLLRSAEVYHTLQRGDEFGVKADNVGIDFARVQERKRGIVDQLHKGVQHLMKKGDITVYEGIGRILGPSIFSPMPGTISVERKDGGEADMLLPKFVMVATGSRPRSLPGLQVDGEYVYTSDEILELKELPKSILIIGGGVIGIEWASMFNDFGVEVEVVEYADRILPLEDEEISKEMTRLLKRRKIKVHTGVKVLPESFSVVDGKAVIKGESGGKELPFTAEKILVSVGRLANTEGIGLENTGIKLEKGNILVNEVYQTAESHIYAIGDCIGGLQLAHVAAHEGIVAVEHMAGLHPHTINYDMIPKCTYSRPEIANVGLTEQQAQEQGYQVKTGKFTFKPIGKALIYGENDGFVKLVVDEKTNDILGVHMIGPHVTDLIAEGALARVLDASPWEIAHTVHAHPTLAEIMGEAALAVEGRPIHG